MSKEDWVYCIAEEHELYVVDPKSAEGQEILLRERLAALERMQEILAGGRQGRVRE